MNHRQFASDVALLCDGLGIERAAFLGESTGSMLQLTRPESPGLSSGGCSRRGQLLLVGGPSSFVSYPLRR